MSNTESPDTDSPEPRSLRSKSSKLVVFAIVVALFLVLWTQFGDTFTLAGIAQRESELRLFQQQNPVLVYGLTFLAYVIATGLSLPGAALMTLAIGWYFELLESIVLVSFASTAGATIAFVLSRYLFYESIQQRFGDRLKSFNESLKREGPFFLFTLRLIPAVPFFVINAVMGLTPIRTRTFWWVSQLGMLPGTILYVYAGWSVPDLQTLADEGIRAAFSGGQLRRILIAFVLLGLFPFVARWSMKRFAHVKPAQLSTSSPSDSRVNDHE
ncbi:TVP38/TMEM64 family protein [Roseiconus lacunae]|uniref:TVP38/TMEM64 family membrane protein n=1 Tax=Roseiconus lacunae TaxID=2605694 RepID=A0ABT7PR37_9BACT|nr:TVP38/TMEM64 family protein [Roseiconus lacunae]MCD0461860.1 TVP38/TMEM64 family protein [Roseiconus lacunae]MDM4018571.1 TVP38/TMEM64 family protein [Roseiconus lacunae]